MTLDELSALLSQAEFHKTLKVEAVALEADGALTLKLPFDDGYTLFKKVGAYHGGVIASLIDVAGTMVCSAVKGRPTPTVDLRVDYLKSPVRCDLYADAVPRRVGRSIGVADVTVRGEDGTVYAIGRGAFSTGEKA